MEFTKQNVEQLNNEANEKNEGLLESVTAYVLDKWDEYDDPKNIVDEILQYGCVSGIVGELCYYSDTTKYYEKHKEEINALLYEIMDECGIYNPKELFSRDPSWDEEDPLALYYYNQNLLAWFGFEETMRRFALKFEELEELV